MLRTCVLLWRGECFISPNSQAARLAILKPALCRRNPNLKMALKQTDVPKTYGPDYFLGKKKSDITKGKEMIYQRSYIDA